MEDFSLACYSQLIIDHLLQLPKSTSCDTVSRPYACAQVGSAYAERASGFLGACLPRGGAFGAPPPGAAAAYGGLPGGGALQRLEAEGLAWVPAWGNAFAALCFVVCLVLNEELMQARALPAAQAI